MQNKSMIFRSSRKWNIPKKKLGGIVIKHPDFEIKSDGNHCYYLCKKMIHKENKDFHCEFAIRKDRVQNIDDLQHSCIPPAGDIRQFTTNIIEKRLDTHELTQLQICFAGKYNLALSSVTSHTHTPITPLSFALRARLLCSVNAFHVSCLWWPDDIRVILGRRPAAKVKSDAAVSSLVG